MDGSSPADRQAVRRAARRSRALRDGVTAGATTTLVVIALVAAVVLAPGWDNVRQSFLSWHDLSRAFPDELRIGYLLFQSQLAAGQSNAAVTINEACVAIKILPTHSV